ncbi:MAG: hypothetical protein C0404_00465 [Verrucomicrobia bacterium]|nr:hypothetical protein [Verrucomicrobiota bacterium]
MKDEIRSIHQLVSGFASGDAISLEALRLRQLCRDMGFNSDIFAPRDRTAPDMFNECRPLEQYEGTAGDSVIFHYSISSPAEDLFLRTRAKRIVYYHNITPAEFFDAFDENIAAQLRLARTRLAEIAGQADAVWAVSDFNASELRAAGIHDVRVFPLLFSPQAANDPCHSGFTVPKELTNILFVGRMAPNKCVEDLISAFAWYHLWINRRSRIFLIGSERTCPAYFTMLQLYARELDLNNVCFQRFVSPTQLQAFYRSADVFVCASRHEGYCLPLLEAMHYGVPVIARNMGGMPEALGGAGILYDDMKPEELATLMHKAISDAALRTRLIESQTARMRDIAGRQVKAEFGALMDGVMSKRGHQ